jgi:chorismate mutase
MALRGIRGATTVEEQTRDAVLSRTEELLTEILRSNPALAAEDIASAFFTTTADLAAAYPAQAARQMGWDQVPMMCAQEIPVPDSLPNCIRVLIHWNTDLRQEEIRHVYLHVAVRLRPDLLSIPTETLDTTE